MAGYNIYYGCIWGTRTAFRIGLQITFIAVTIGLVIGCLAGYLGGVIDGVLMMLTDIFSGLPSLLLAMVLIASTELPSWLGSIPGFWGALSKLDKIVLALAFTTWTTYARLVRGQVMKVKNEDYVEAAEAVGCSDSRIMVRHVLPNSISPLLAMASLNFGGVILTAATLSFLGIGIPVGYADWAPFIASSRNYIIPSAVKYWYSFLIPSIFLVTFVLGWALLGDALNEIQDPRIRRI